MLVPRAWRKFQIINFRRSYTADRRYLANRKNDTLRNFDNKTADINTKNCSLSIVLTATDQTPQKSLKR